VMIVMKMAASNLAINVKGGVQFNAKVETTLASHTHYCFVFLSRTHTWYRWAWLHETWN